MELSADTGAVNTAGAGDEAAGSADDGVMVFPNDPHSVLLARRAARFRLLRLGLDTITTTAELVVGELVANAVFHTDGPIRLEIRPEGEGVRLSVFDISPLFPVVPAESDSSMTGRGLLLVRRLSTHFGFERTVQGKVVWAEVFEERLEGDFEVGGTIEAWIDDGYQNPTDPAKHRVELGDVPTELLLAAKSHVDNLVREFQLAGAGAGTGSTAAVPPRLAELIETVTNHFSETRLSIKRQALEAERLGLGHVHLRLELGPDAADAGLAYLRALDEADDYCRASRLLTLETPPRQRVFRQWYVGELVTQLRRAEAGLPVHPVQPFEERLLDEIDTVAAARATAERSARLYALASALAGAVSPEQVAQAVLGEGVAALGAAGGGLLLATGSDRLSVPGTVGYDESVVASLRSESSAAELPAAVALRTGEPVWLESREERDKRFPELIELERRTVSMCAVPLQVGDRRLGAIRFSFSRPRLFDEDERRFVLALAALAGQALDRAQLYQDRSELSQRLQRSLLPPGLPAIPGISSAAVYEPLGNGVEVGGDFYDVWALSATQWAFALGDICGTGPEAAGLSALVRYSLRAIATPDADHSAVLRRLNDVLLNAGIDEERFCTVIFGTIQPAPTGARLRIATGGHPEPVYRRAGGEVVSLAVGGSLLGILPAVNIGITDLTLGPGDSIVFYSDGVTEARCDGVMFGTEGLIRAVGDAGSDAEGTAASVAAAVVTHSGGVLDDDVAVLVFRADGEALES